MEKADRPAVDGVNFPNFRRDGASAVGTDGRESPNLSVEPYAAQR